MFSRSFSGYPGLGLDSLTLDFLTLDERTELERASDGPITSAMIADKIRARGRCTNSDGTSPQYLRALLIWARSDLKFYEAQIVYLEAEMVALMADRDHLYAATERDRQTRHIAALNRQRTALIEDCRHYQCVIQSTVQKLAAHQNVINE